MEETKNGRNSGSPVNIPLNIYHFLAEVPHVWGFQASWGTYSLYPFLHVIA